MKIEIVVPSYGRGGKMKIVQNHPEICRNAILVVREEQLTAYRWDVSKFKRVHTVSGVSGIADTRKRIFETIDADFIMMMDDDVLFSKLVNDKGSYARLRTANDHGSFMERLDRMCRDYTFVSVIRRQGIHQYHKRPGFKPTIHGGQPLRAWGMHRDLAKMINWSIPVMEDYYIGIQVPVLGHLHGQIADYVVDEAKPEGGGCALWRTDEIQAGAAKFLADTYPDYVQLADTVSGVRIDWQKLRKLVPTGT